MRSSALRFVPPVALMALIYVLSAQPDLSTGLGFWDLVLRKLAHAGVFAALTLLWLHALRPLIARALLAAVAISFLYAIADEYHQTFVSGRHGSPADVGIDAIGIGVAVLIVWSGRLKWVSAGSKRPPADQCAIQHRGFSACAADQESRKPKVTGSNPVGRALQRRWIPLNSAKSLTTS